MLVLVLVQVIGLQILSMMNVIEIIAVIAVVIVAVIVVIAVVIVVITDSSVLVAKVLELWLVVVVKVATNVAKMVILPVNALIRQLEIVVMVVVVMVVVTVVIAIVTDVENQVTWQETAPMMKLNVVVTSVLAEMTAIQVVVMHLAITTMETTAIAVMLTKILAGVLLKATMEAGVVKATNSRTMKVLGVVAQPTIKPTIKIKAVAGSEYKQVNMKIEDSH